MVLRDWPQYFDFFATGWKGSSTFHTLIYYFHRYLSLFFSYLPPHTLSTISFSSISKEHPCLQHRTFRRKSLSVVFLTPLSNAIAFRLVWGRHRLLFSHAPPPPLADRIFTQVSVFIFHYVCHVFISPSFTDNLGLFPDPVSFFSVRFRLLGVYVCISDCKWLHLQLTELRIAVFWWGWYRYWNSLE